jgi:hypothetical protein
VSLTAKQRAMRQAKQQANRAMRPLARCDWQRTNSQGVHNSYPELWTRYVDNYVDDLGRTRGEHVGNGGRTGMAAQVHLGSPRQVHSHCAQRRGLKLGKQRFPQFPRPL